ncbi:monofunctional biosynthetic peptidoglycan transglycosylase [Brucellaceae bacterium C25G]
MRFVFKVCVFLLFLPVFLLGLYKIPFVHPVSTLMLKDQVLLQTMERQWVDIEDISPHLINAVMMSEDGQFCSHGGVDWHQMSLVVKEAVSGAPSRGASTITMQTAKNLFLWNGRSYFRKALELPVSMAADMLLSKKRIMEIYLNIAEWGPGIYGAEAAAQHYFNRPASKLTLQQASLLAVTLPNPKMRNPAKPNRAMLRTAGIVQNRAKKAGPYVTCVQ